MKLKRNSSDIKAVVLNLLWPRDHL